MVGWELSNHLATFVGSVELNLAVQETRLGLKLVTAAAIALLMSLVLGPFVIGWLRSRFRERIASDSNRLNELHASKKDTPTMGGVLIVGTFLASVVTQIGVASCLLWIIIGGTLSLMAIGSYDDWIKLRTTRKGLTVQQKFLAQILVSFAIAMGLQCLNPIAASEHNVALLGVALPNSTSWLFLPWSTLVIVATTNSVNLTDGLDGLAAGCSAITGLALTVILASNASVSTVPSWSSEAAITCAALTGSTLGFLWFNRHPARVFMGDAGSLPIGGILAISTLACRIELSLFLIGAVFVVETLSVVMQVAWYRRTRRRILLCSPLHNHFVFQGVRENKIVTGFWIAAALCSALGIAILW